MSKKILLFAVGAVLAIIGIKLAMDVVNSAFAPLMTAVWSVL